MGGIFKSWMIVNVESYGQFFGIVLLENNGGFVFCWVIVEKIDMSGIWGVCFRVWGDGQCYDFRVWLSGFYSWVFYWVGFIVNDGDWYIVELFWSVFEFIFRG